MQLNWYYFASLVFVVWCLRHFKEATSQVRLAFLWKLSSLTIFTYLFNLWYFSKIAHVLTLLPLQLCNIGVLLIPVALKTRKKALVDFLFYACGLGALAAILVVSKEYHNTYSLFTFSFYVFHFLIFIIPVFMSVWGFHTLDPNPKEALSVTLILMALSIVIHGINLWLNQIGVPGNYFFTIRSLSVASNEAFALFAKLIPYDYFYMYLVFPILYAYMGLVHIVLGFLSRRHPVTNSKMQMR